MWAVGEAPRLLTDDMYQASLGPDGYLWAVTGPDGDLAVNVYVATPDEVRSESAATRPLDEWTEVPMASPVLFGDLAHGTADGVLMRVVDEESDGYALVLVGLDGSIRTILGGADEDCGLNRSATASYGRYDFFEVSRDEDRSEPVHRMPLEEAAPAADGGVWLVLPAADPSGERVHSLGRIDPDGTLRRVEHALPPIESIAPSPDGDSVLVTDWRGRLLELTDPDAHAEPLPPPPEGCQPGDPAAPAAAAGVASSSARGRASRS